MKPKQSNSTWPKKITVTVHTETNREGTWTFVPTQDSKTQVTIVEPGGYIRVAHVIEAHKCLADLRRYPIRDEALEDA